MHDIVGCCTFTAIINQVELEDRSWEPNIPFPKHFNGDVRYRSIPPVFVLLPSFVSRCSHTKIKMLLRRFLAARLLSLHLPKIARFLPALASLHHSPSRAVGNSLSSSARLLIQPRPSLFRAPAHSYSRLFYSRPDQKRRK